MWFVRIILSSVCIVRDTGGSVLAAMFGLDLLLGRCMGSGRLVGGHGAIGSFGSFLEESYGVVGATPINFCLHGDKSIL